MSTERWPDLIKPEKCVRLTVRGDPSGRVRVGYVATVSEAAFEFDLVLNSGAHFGNESAAPELRREHIRFADLLAVTD